MSIALPQLGPHPTGEWHTTELIATCPRKAFLRLNGHGGGLVETALFEGLLFGEMAERWHHTRSTDPDPAIEAVRVKIKEEGRSFSASVVANMDSLADGIKTMILAYADRFGSYFDACTLIGTEVPCRMTIDVDFEDAVFASHMDLVFEGPHPLDMNGARYLQFWDWKKKKDAPGPFFLARNLQFGMYGLCIAEGSVLLDGEWACLGQKPLAYWLNANGLAPYGRKTQSKNDLGKKVEFKKGDPRPLRKVMVPCRIDDLDAVRSMFSERVRMARAGFWPAIPDMVGCGFCDVSHVCPSFASVSGDLEGIDDE